MKAIASCAMGVPPMRSANRAVPNARLHGRDAHATVPYDRIFSNPVLMVGTPMTQLLARFSVLAVVSHLLQGVVSKPYYPISHSIVE